MKTSSNIFTVERFANEEKTIELLAKAGFDGWDFTLMHMVKYDFRNKIYSPSDHPLAGKNYLQFARRLRQVGLDNGIVCNQSHAPYPPNCPQVRSFYKRALECSAEAGAEICVMHPIDNAPVEVNTEMYLELLPFAKECGVKIAAENLWCWDWDKSIVLKGACSEPVSYSAHLNAINDDFFVACVDTGHAALKGLDTSAVELIDALGSKVQALHINDNDMIDDLHLLPYDGKVDFEAVVQALKRNKYKGWFTMEAYHCLDNYDETNYVQGVQRLADCARKLAVMFENMEVQP